MKRAQFERFAALILFVGFSAVQCLAVGAVNTKKGLAIRGYDAVAYFTQGRAVKGDKKHSYRWRDAEWRFSTQENRDLFAADPEKYAPQYGGYCAYAASQNRIYDANPDYWRIVDGKLYLNYNSTAQERWEKDLHGNIAAGDRYWPELVKK